MRVLAVSGKDRIGKSESLKKLISWIKATDPGAHEVSGICCNIFGHVSDGKVSRSVFVWEAGDNLHLVQEGIKAFRSISDPVDVFVIASRTKANNGYKELEKVFSGNITFIRKSQVDSSGYMGGSIQKHYEDIDNAAFAEELKRFIFD